MSSPVQGKAVLRVLGSLLTMFSLTMVPPVVIGLIYRDGAILPFVLAFITTLLTGMLLLWPVREEVTSLRLRDGFVVVVMFWTVLSVFGGLPFYLSQELDLTVSAAIFESVSGLTRLWVWMNCHAPSCFTANKCSGWVGWASLC